MLAAMSRPTAADLVRPPRRPGVAMLALLWVLIALMPLRALSQELMGAAQHSAHSAGAPMAAMPCHAGVGHVAVDSQALHHTVAADAASTNGAADAVNMADGADVTDNDEPASNCSACDLCHAALAGPVYVTQELPLPAASGRVATPSGPSAAVSPDGIFKPPRG
ncbi:MAG: hypothetical protein A3E25_00725 [Burkholderiales bacterium RIFCSPHIGHO2_12_FULL_69_20]|nr:MAG: hypothetical protein A3E25_00725 [Burkholderiales bacterium RIFCSPHIGHO2_12_FULL_69_20]